MHVECEEIFGNAELNLEATCTCGCHNNLEEIKIVPDSVRAREHFASVSQKQMTFDEIGAKHDKCEDDR